MLTSRHFEIESDLSKPQSSWCRRLFTTVASSTLLQPTRTPSGSVYRRLLSTTIILQR
ncbi:hypothetical protein N665_1364s0005 [Sinapis alba]|nr:hypothetical protein N665_1364s0005 [Sinapis alba]